MTDRETIERLSKANCELILAAGDLHAAIARLTRERDEAAQQLVDCREARDSWAHQCNMASEAQANALNESAKLRCERDDARAMAQKKAEAFDQQARLCEEIAEEEGQARAEIARLRAEAEATRKCHAVYTECVETTERELRVALADRDARLRRVEELSHLRSGVSAELRAAVHGWRAFDGK